MKRYDEVILFTGGIDSYIGYHYLMQPQPVYFDLNSKYTEKELKYIPPLLKKHGDHKIIIDKSLAFLGKHEQKLNAHVPFRNLYLALTAVTNYADIVFICGVKDDNMTDKNKEVFDLWSEHFSKLEDRKIKVKSPFWEKTKADIIEWYSKRFDKEDLLDTVSCYDKSLTNYCGKCQSCFRKACALFKVGIELPFHDKKIIKYYKKRIGKKIYDEEREENMINYLLRDVGE
jgi:7-cyano-7-deazaguanine synthase in queuosine biosynthesis